MKQRFDDGSAIEWTVNASIRRVLCKPIDCFRTPSC